ncbi:RNA polymerase sigma-54 factor 2 [Terricaulis silvestris]|uniref:RNA polymerase sigma-54 factor n=2 Tax=Terricaulis silvestris TaxID=2686094 RepID=A0A6I6MQM2_9CAUL|nr:RNA polymerase sigma-54 factor 2 [Terricaulis silvestris]
MTPRLEMRQGQALVMTPQLQQAIKLLQLSNVELQEFVEGELERNPLLEREEGSAEAQKPASDSGDAQQLDFDTGVAPAEAALDVSVADMAPDLSANELSEAGAAPMTDWSKAGSGKGFDDLPGIEETLANDLTLAEHLDAQLTQAGLSPVERLIGGVLIDAVDDWGYVRADMRELARQMACGEADVLRVLGVMQGFEPVGVMARDIAECLTLQLKDRGRFDPAMEKLLGNLELLGKGHFERLQHICEVDRDDLMEMVAEIRALTPKPGAGFGGGAVQSVAPDVYIKQAPDGTWLVELNTDTMPRVLMNQRYYATVSKTAKREEDKQFLTECAANASWLVKSLDQRARTILKVAREIVRQQDGFFDKGVAHLRPLNLKTVAAAIEMHESTVSRVTSNKYLSCARGVFELKYFFTASINSSDGGESHSAEAVRFEIKGLIDREAESEILSDDRIVEILREKGIDIARRTVAKYRESLRIPSSVERKRKLAHGL